MIPSGPAGPPLGLYAGPPFIATGTRDGIYPKADKDLDREFKIF